MEQTRLYEKCPKCGGNSFVVIKDSVDIGVGDQEFTTGGECTSCGQLEFCSYCGAWETKEGMIHNGWCNATD